MKTKTYLMIGILFLPLLLTAQQKWTLEQCIDTAWTNNRNVKQQALAKKTREINYEQARQNLLPSVNASASQNFNLGSSVDKFINPKSSTSVGLGAQLTLFDGLRMKYNIDARKAEMLQSDAELQKLKLDIATYVAAGFLQILQNKELLQIATDQLELTKTKIEQRKNLVAAGKLAEGELLDLVAQQSKEEMNRLKAENTYKLSLLDLAQLLEIDHFEDLELAVPENITELELQILSPDEVLKSALTHRPEILGADYKLKSSEINALSAKSEYYPTLTLGAQSGTGYYNFPGAGTLGKQFSDNFNTVVGLNLQIPIFNKFSVRNKVRTAQIGIESDKLNVSNAKLELRKTIQQAYFNAISAKSRWESAQKSEAASREAYRFTNQKYEAGRATVYELYQSKSNLTQVLSEGVQAKYEYVFRIKLLEYLK
ncbi:MAG TPA: TolC family protein [Paludibacter sp.]|nr:TolC family protein [Paludibacter sp.]